MSRDNFWFTRVVGIRIRNEAPPDPEMGPGISGLVSYGIDQLETVREAASYVDRILRVANPADLPVQLPTKFSLVVNIKTAKGLGLTIPESFLLFADEVIE